VIVPTRNRATYLPGVLNALLAQVYPAELIDVTVVDNSSTDDTEAVVRAAAAHAPFPIRYVRKEDRGPAASRNLGATLSNGELIALTDSDCLPDPGWLRHAVRYFEPGVGLVCGPIVPINPDGPVRFLMHQIHPVGREDGLYATANIVYLRSAFEQLGGFVESFGAFSWGQPVGGDDTDLAWRVKRAGYRSAFAPASIVYHQATPIGPKAALLVSMAAQVIPWLVRLFPELRHTCLWQRYFIHRASATFYALLAGLVLTRRSRWATLLTLPWLVAAWPALRPYTWPPGRWGWLALMVGLKLESSALLTITLVCSSIRHRTLVL
jgi:cellulose synthase/poly-beta-1,6-N-acetylglucosamine synthase-like glycosyltransferase